MTTNNVTENVSQLLQTSLIKSIEELNTGIDGKVIRDAVQEVTNTLSKDLVSSVNSAGSSQLNTIPSNIVGTNNPVNLVSSNLGSSGIFNNLSNAVDNAVSPEAIQKIITSLKSQLATTLPPDSPELQNFNNQTENLSYSIADVVTKAVGDTFQAYTEGLFSNTPSVKSAITSAVNLFKGAISDTGFSADAVEKALEAIDLNFSNNLAGDTLNQVKSFSIENTDNEEKLIATKVGFMDPSATYPTKDYANEPETNKLARGEINGTVVQKKNNDRVIEAKLPYNDSFSEPLSPFNGEYPYNKVTQTESGHIIEVDDTPGNERLHIYHRSGTYIEIDSNGSVVKRTRGSSYEIIDCNGKIAILGKADISVNGACNIFVGNDVNMEVMGDVNLTCHNDITAQAGGIMNLSAKEEINIHSERINIEADKILNVLSDGEIKVLSGADTHLKSNTNSYISADGSMHVNAYSNTFVTAFETTHIVGKLGVLVGSSEGSIDAKSGGRINLQSGMDTNIKTSVGNFNVDASRIYLNSGRAGAAILASFAKAAALAPVSNVGLLEGRKYSDIVNITDPEPIRYDARYTEVSEGAELSSKELKNQKDSIVLAGIASKDELEDPNPIVIEEKKPSSTQNNIIMPTEKLLQVTVLPGNYQLSPSFTLDNMWRNVAVSPGKHPIQPQIGLTYGQIVYNLQALALNILEPVKALYPKVIITSAFRHESGNSKSAHPAGLACDLQFPGASREEYYEIAVKLAQVLSYDQVLLEYWAQANNPWIHIGLAPRGQFNPQSQRKVAWTFKDHALYKQSLVNLA